MNGNSGSGLEALQVAHNCALPLGEYDIVTVSLTMTLRQPGRATIFLDLAALEAQ